jgi:hypothetical protein
MESIGFICKKKIIANFHVLGYFIPKNEFRAKKQSVCHTALPEFPALPSGRWSKFVSTISQPS